jgi:phage-related protein
MAFDTFVPPRCPNQGSARQVTARTREAQFGDGYSQRAVDGLNSIGKLLSLEWPLLTQAQAQEIEDFFKAKGGATAFLYQPPKESAPLQWICKEWTRTSGGPREALSANFIQVFDL